jgi:hypothetical protein
MANNIRLGQVAILAILAILVGNLAKKGIYMLLLLLKVAKVAKKIGLELFWPTRTVQGGHTVIQLYTPTSRVLGND